MNILIFSVLSYILLSVSLYFLFPKIGISGVKGLIPGVNFIEWAKAVGRPNWWAVLLLIPLVNFFIYAGLTIDMVRSFGKFGFWESVLSVVYAPISFFRIAFGKDTYNGPILSQENAYKDKIEAAENAGDKYELEKLLKNNPFKKNAGREWAESIIFAVFAAALIRMFLVEAYVIPTPSMEGSLMVGDFLFVSKASYGIRTPMTVAMVPLLHNRLPFVDKESYLTNPSLPYYRTPGFSKVKRNDPFVFNWPVGDSVYVTKMRSYTVAQVKQTPGMLQRDRELRQMVKKRDYIVRPIDKKDHYIKRCVALPGDSLRIINRELYINGEKGEEIEHVQFLYEVSLPQGTVNKKKLVEWGINPSDGEFYNGRAVAYHLDKEQAEKLASIDPKVKIKVHENKTNPNALFPNDPKYYNKWSIDNYGPIWIPKEGESAALTLKTLPLYRRIISVYEHNNLEVKNGTIFINGSEANSYTFKQNYYWAMGDNRHNSEDSRFWGFVPEDHLVGKPIVVWFSLKNGQISNGVNWDRVFSIPK